MKFSLIDFFACTFGNSWEFAACYWKICIQYCSLSVLSFCPSSIHLTSNTRHLDGTFAWYAVSFACSCIAAWVSGIELYFSCFRAKRCNLASSTLEGSYIVTWNFSDCFKSSPLTSLFCWLNFLIMKCHQVCFKSAMLSLFLSQERQISHVQGMLKRTVVPGVSLFRCQLQHHGQESSKTLSFGQNR